MDHAFGGNNPVGCLAAGSLADVIGAPYAALAVFGAVCAAGAGFLYYRMPLLRTHIRPPYVRAGVMEK